MMSGESNYKGTNPAAKGERNVEISDKTLSLSDVVGGAAAGIRSYPRAR